MIQFKEVLDSFKLKKKKSPSFAKSNKFDESKSFVSEKLEKLEFSYQLKPVISNTVQKGKWVLGQLAICAHLFRIQYAGDSAPKDYAWHKTGNSPRK